MALSAFSRRTCLRVFMKPLEIFSGQSIVISRAMKCLFSMVSLVCLLIDDEMISPLLMTILADIILDSA